MTDRVAADVYRIVEQPRDAGPARNAFAWVGTVVAGLFDAGSSSPTVSDLAIQQGDVVVKVIEIADIAEFSRMREALDLELETSTPEAFAAAWELPTPPREG